MPICEAFYNHHFISTDRKKACAADNQQSVNKFCEISNNKYECYESRKIQNKNDAPADELPLNNRQMAGKSKDSIGRQFGSPENMMLLGGKSTPFSKKSGDQETKVDKETTAVCEPQASSSTKEINIQKNLNKTVTAGLTGLENYANNCYMNVVIQVLANIPEVREYFAGKISCNLLARILFNSTTFALCQGQEHLCALELYYLSRPVPLIILSCPVQIHLCFYLG